MDESDVPEMRKIVELPITEDAEPVEDGMENAEYATVEEDAEVTDESPETEPVDQAMAEEMESGGDEVAEVEAEPEAEPEPAPVDRTKLWEGVAYTSQGTPEHQVKAIVIMGSRDQVYSLHGWNEFEDSVVGKTMSDEDLIIIGHKILNGMRDLGYVFTRVKFDKKPLAAGYVAYKVQAGEVGDVTVKGNRHYRADQVISSLSAHKGEGFNYNNLYSEVFSLNVKPDIRVDTKLNPRVGDDGEAIVDMDLEVEDRLPLHAAVTLSNTGTKETSDWRLRTVLQHVNLTKADDVLTAQWLTDPTDFDQVNAWSGSYYRPLGDGWSLNLYGGYSDSNIENFALDEFDIFGEGMFAGFRVTKMLYENPQMAVDASVGYTYQQIENNTEFAGQSFPDWEKDITLGMPYLTLG
jgi:hemolysin activation/secretion protein